MARDVNFWSSLLLGMISPNWYRIAFHSMKKDFHWVKCKLILCGQVDVHLKWAIVIQVYLQLTEGIPHITLKKKKCQVYSMIDATCHISSNLTTSRHSVGLNANMAMKHTSNSWEWSRGVAPC